MPDKPHIHILKPSEMARSYFLHKTYLTKIDALTHNIGRD